MRNIFLITLLMAGLMVQAKKVKFAVDMTGQTINANGIHLSGDMQDEAGYPADWEPNTIALAKEGTTNIYSVILDIPAHRKYEYKFVNGDLFYEVEFVPEESRVGYEFNDNRWIYIDSLANDTFLVGPLLFAGNAPAGQKLIHFKVDMKSAGTIDAAGIHLASSLNGWNYETVKMYSFGTKVYEYHGYADTAALVTYKFVNGNTLAKAETVPTSCADGGNRSITATTDLVLDSICFASCNTCGSTGLQSLPALTGVKIYPNPTQHLVTVSLDNDMLNTVTVLDVSGKSVLTYENINSKEISIDLSMLDSGLYFIRLKQGNTAGVQKLLIEK